MKIKNFTPSNTFKANGLVFAEMKNLKQVVALFGKNGSGKSRLLNYLPNEINQKVDRLRKLNKAGGSGLFMSIASREREKKNYLK
jgi:putative ribosome biogenesis GTPase RsgA